MAMKYSALDINWNRKLIIDIKDTLYDACTTQHEQNFTYWRFIEFHIFGFVHQKLNENCMLPWCCNVSTGRNVYCAHTESIVAKCVRGKMALTYTLSISFIWEWGYGWVTAYRPRQQCSMMTSSNRNSFRVTGPLWGEFTRRRWILLTKASDAEFWCFLWSAPEHTVSKQSRHRAHYDFTVMRLNDITDVGSTLHQTTLLPRVRCNFSCMP